MEAIFLLVSFWAGPYLELSATCLHHRSAEHCGLDMKMACGRRFQNAWMMMQAWRFQCQGTYERRSLNALSLRTRKTLNEKIAQLNAAIDEVSSQLRAEDDTNEPPAVTASEGEPAT